MPAIRLKTNVSLEGEVGASLSADLSRITAETIGKPERYVMAVCEEASMVMGGEDAPAAFVEVGSIGGLGGEVPGRLTALICDALKKRLGIPPDRVYVCFTDVSADKWGWNGSTFG